MTTIELYSKEGCHLCDEAKAVLEKIRKEIPFALREIKLVPGGEYHEEYKELVPVIHINRVFAFKHRVTESMVETRLRQLSIERPVQTTQNNEVSE